MPDIAAVRARYFPFTTRSGYEIRAVPEAELRAFVKEAFDKVFPASEERGAFVMPEDRRESKKPLGELYRKLHHEFFLVFDPAGRPVGWNMSEAEDVLTFYLRNTGLLPEHRRKGIYTDLSARLEEYLHELGYERLTSHHQATNREVLIRKLKDGFVIAGFELTERWGALVKMVKLLERDRNEAFYRMFGSREHLQR